jgi:polyisoprenoid-binding protein YceI
MPNFQPAPSDSFRTSIPAGTYTVDTAHSDVAFRAKAFGLKWARGHIPVGTGTIEVVTDGCLTGHGQLAADQITTGLAPRDWHLRSSHYLHTAKHPTITVAINSADFATGQASCDVTIRDAAAPVQMELQSVEFIDGGLHLRAATTVDRTVYPMLPPLAGVSRQVHLEVTVVARRADSNKDVSVIE